MTKVILSSLLLVVERTQLYYKLQFFARSYVVKGHVALTKGN